MGYIDETWYVGSDGHKYYLDVVCHHQMHIFNSSFYISVQNGYWQKNQIYSNWYAHVKSNLRPLPT